MVAHLHPKPATKYLDELYERQVSLFLYSLETQLTRPIDTDTTIQATAISFVPTPRLLIAYSLVCESTVQRPTCALSVVALFLIFVLIAMLTLEWYFSVPENDRWTPNHASSGSNCRTCIRQYQCAVVPTRHAAKRWPYDHIFCRSERKGWWPQDNSDYQVGLDPYSLRSRNICLIIHHPEQVEQSPRW